MGRFDEALIAIDEYEKVDKANGGKNSGDIKNLRDKIEKKGGMRLIYRQIRKHNKRTRKYKKTKKYKKNKKNKRTKIQKN